MVEKENIEKQIDLTFGVSSVKVEHFSLTEYGKEVDYVIDFNNYEYQVTVQTTTKPEEKISSIKLSITVQEIKNEYRLPIAELVTINSFSIVNFEEAIPMQGDSFHVPIPFLINITGLSISTARGVLASSFKGTKFENSALPLIDPSFFFQQYINV
jgi:hypothetical protein